MSDPELFVGDGYMGEARAEIQRPDGLLFSMTLNNQGVTEMRCALSSEDTIDFLKQTLKMVESGGHAFDAKLEEAKRMHEAEGN